MRKRIKCVADGEGRTGEVFLSIIECTAHDEEGLLAFTISSFSIRRPGLGHPLGHVVFSPSPLF